MHYVLHDKGNLPLKGERHDPDQLPSELLEQIRQLTEVGKGRQHICETLGLAWRTLDRIADAHGLTFKQNKRTDDEIEAVLLRYGGLDQLVQALTQMRSDGVGWQRIATRVGLNRYACKILVEERRVPTFRS